ncbi:Lipoma-preferred partner [Liparis tanakae]|uniref:Lipoma-preferred partner n=1 Tax=Liparis tanakae TaxID=230148 RepID=A0A4Z2I9U6_9TELE|nr:Lipoma-preferred partner [Liparis tanakae]
MNGCSGTVHQNTELVHRNKHTAKIKREMGRRPRVLSLCSGGRHDSWKLWGTYVLHGVSSSPDLMSSWRTMWNPVNSNDQTGQVAARMETTLGSASISVSQQQAPKKCAPPMVAPKPKFNPYKHAGESAFSDAAVVLSSGVVQWCCTVVLQSDAPLTSERIFGGAPRPAIKRWDKKSPVFEVSPVLLQSGLPTPSATCRRVNRFLTAPWFFPVSSTDELLRFSEEKRTIPCLHHPDLTEVWVVTRSAANPSGGAGKTEAVVHIMRGPEKTLQERRSSLDAEIDSLTSILADLESSSPYKPRVAQVNGLHGPDDHKDSLQKRHNR